MISKRMSLVGAGVAMLVTLLGAWEASAQAWKPEKPVEIVIGTSPGGPQDRTGRTIQRILQEQKLVTTPVNVVNKAGGGGAVGLSYSFDFRAVARAARPEGHEPRADPVPG